MYRHHCKHFTGLMDTYCAVGICYRDKRDISRPGMATWPCTDPTCPTTCEQREEWTDEEYAERERQHHEYLAGVINQLTAFEDRRSEDCPHCGQHVASLRKVGRCVYASPCNCRVWQGTIPAAWR